VNLESAIRFNDRAFDYVRYRPTYPAEAIDSILDGLAASSELVAADLGAGTGISARLLGDRGVRVVAVEPSAGMRQFAARHSNVRLLRELWERHADAEGLVTLVYDTEVYRADKLLKGQRSEVKGQR
jgi:SAM-dependent methyltransferase